MKRFGEDKRGALIINLFGGPGSGKSTVAARIFAELKLRGIEAACPEEHAKLAIWSGRPWLLDEQIILVGKEWETINNLRDKVDVIVMDSPILLCSVYAGLREPQAFHDLTIDLHKRTPRINVMVNRPQAEPYQHINRRENAEQAVEVDVKLRELLNSIGEPPEEISRQSDVKLFVDEVVSFL